MTNTKKGIRMIRYSTQPSQEANALQTKSPTAPIKTTSDVMNLNGIDNHLEDNNSLQDLDAQDEDDN